MNQNMYQAMQQMPGGFGPAGHGPNGFGPDVDDDTYEDPRQHEEQAPAWARRLEARLDRIEDELSEAFSQQDQDGGAFPGGVHPHHVMAAHATGQMVRSQAAQHLVQQVAGDLGREAQEFVIHQIQGLDAHAIARILNSPAIMAFLHRAAKMEHHERSGPGTSAPQGEGVWHGGDNLDGDAQKEIESYMKAFGPMGATQDMAVKAYQRATGGRR